MFPGCDSSVSMYWDLAGVPGHLQTSLKHHNLMPTHSSGERVCGKLQDNTVHLTILQTQGIMSTLISFCSLILIVNLKKEAYSFHIFLGKSPSFTPELFTDEFIPPQYRSKLHVSPALLSQDSIPFRLQELFISINDLNWSIFNVQISKIGSSNNSGLFLVYLKTLPFSIIESQGIATFYVFLAITYSFVQKWLSGLP